MLKRLNNDQALAPYVAQFVPIKLDTSTDDWQKWERSHKSEGGGIPIVYIVRADGETLYAKSGSLKSAALAELLGQCLENSGRVFSEREIMAMLAADEEVTKLREKGEVAKAISKLSKLKKIGKAGQLGSYAKPAIALDQQVIELTEKGKEDLSKILKSLTDADDEAKKVATLSHFLSVNERYGKLKTLKEDFTKINRIVTRNTELRGMYRDIKTIERYQTAKSATAIKRAVDALNKIATTRSSGVLSDRAKQLAERLTKKLESKDTSTSSSK